ncbi:MAG TPA: sugar ABC transporter permease [Chloroflexota bacterium]
MATTARRSALDRFRARGLSRHQLGYVLVAPALLLIAATVVVPMGHTIALALQTVRLNLPNLPQGFNNFQNFGLLVQDPVFWSAVQVSVVLVLVNILFCLVLGMIIALILNESFAGRGVVRAAMLIPWAMPGVVIATLWRFMFNDNYGVVNDILLRVGLIPSYQNILGGPWALPGVIAAMVWRSTPFTALLILAGLQVIPGELYEAAKIDGANAYKRFAHVTLPLVKSSLMIALIFRSLDAFREFDILYNLTAGGPGITTQNLSLYTYKTYFSFLNFGYGSTLALAMTLISGVFVFFYIRLVGMQLSSRWRD